MKNYVNSVNMWEINQLFKKNTKTILSICRAWFNLTDMIWSSQIFRHVYPQVVQSLKRPLASPVVATESKRPSIIQTLPTPVVTSKLVSPKLLSFTIDPNKTAEQLSVLRSSYTQCPFPEEDEVRISEWNDILLCNKDFLVLTFL